MRRRLGFGATASNEPRSFQAYTTCTTMLETDEREPQNLVTIELIDVGDALLALLRLNRPKDMNPLDWDTVRALGHALNEMANNDAVRAIAITGAGRAFSAGGDMKRYRELERDATQFPRFLADIHAVFSQIPDHPKPVLALVNGIAVAGGLELILFCDVAYMAESAKIGDAHLTYGQMGGGGVLTMLPRAIGPTRARELILSGRLLTSGEALAWGLVSKIVPDTDLITAGVAFAQSVAAKSPLAIANAKRTLNAGLWQGTGVDAALRLEREVTSRYCLTSEDAPEGLDAFSEKRAPKWVGR